MHEIASAIRKSEAILSTPASTMTRLSDIFFRQMGIPSLFGLESVLRRDATNRLESLSEGDAHLRKKMSDVFRHMLRCGQVWLRFPEALHLVPWRGIFGR